MHWRSSPTGSWWEVLRGVVPAGYRENHLEPVARSWRVATGPSSRSHRGAIAAASVPTSGGQHFDCSAFTTCGRP